MTAEIPLDGEQLAALTDRAAGASEEIRDRAVLELVDAVACMALGASHPLVLQVAAAANWLEPGPHRAFAATRVGLEQAIRLDALACHVDELDSIAPSSAVVPAALVIPAALQVALWRGAPGEKLVEAIVAGYDVVTACGRALGGSAAYSDGWWPSSTVGALGATAAAGVLLDLDTESLVAAFGLAAARTGGLLSDDDLGAAHYLSAADTTVAGVRAALLAGHGLTGSRTYLSGPLDRALRSWRPIALPAPGDGLRATMVKPFPCARPLQGVAAALAAADLPVERLTSVRVELPAPLLQFVTADVDVPDATAAAASLAHVVAAARLGRVADARFYRAAAIEDSANLPALELVALPGAPAGSWRCRVHLRDSEGREQTLEHEPPSVETDGVVPKALHTLATAGIERVAAERTVRMLTDVRTCADVTGLSLHDALSAAAGWLE